MTEVERHRIVSNDFADFIIDYGYNYNLFKDLKDITINPVNKNYAIGHIPVENFSQYSISKYGYYTIPSCYGLLTNDVKKDINIFTEPQTDDSEDTSGLGVLIGFIDTGIDYTHTAFLDMDNKTRIVSIWDQTIESNNSNRPNLNYGTEYTKEQIDKALRAPNPFDIVPSRDDIGHGTMLAGYAAGSSNPDNNFSGVAAGAELVVVKLKQAKPSIMEFFEIPRDAICYQENDIIMGVKYLDEVAKRLQKPLVICIGLGSSLGDHTGGRVIGRYLSTITGVAGRSIIAAGGNEGNRGTHYYSNYLAPSNSKDVILRVGEDREGFTIQFLGISPNYIWIDLYAPGDVFLSRVPPIRSRTSVINFEDTTINIDVLQDVPNFYEQSIVLRFENPESGDWKFHVYGSVGDLSMEFHFWLPIHNFLSDKTFFLEPDNYTTLTEPSNNQILITSVAYDPTTVTLEQNGGKGFAANYIPKPDVTAAGVNVLCPFPNNQYVLGSGSSLSAGFTSGVAARIYEWAIIEGNFPKMNQPIMKKVMVQSAYRMPNIDYPNREWGYGVLSADRIKVVLKGLNNLI